MRETGGGKPGGSWRRNTDAVALALYAALTLLLTWPLARHAASAARDWGDPFLTSWIMAWQLERWAALDLSGYFDGNVFYPHLGTLAYSEILLPQTVTAAPVYYLSGNALLANNVVILVSFVASALCAYLLVKHLSGSAAAGFVGGVIFAFNPFMFDHLPHVQVIGAAGLPLALLWLHRYFDTGAGRYVALFTATYVAQALANGYYAVYLTYAAGAFILYHAWLGGHLRQARFWKHMAAHALVSAALLVPLLLQYAAVRREMGFQRTMMAVEGWPLLATSKINRLYGGLTLHWSSPEAKLFPGFVAAALALAGVAWILWSRSRAQRRAETGGPDGLAYRILGWAAVISALAIINIAVTGGFHTSLLGLPLRSSGYDHPAVILMACLAARFVMRRRHALLRSLTGGGHEKEVFYVALLAVGVVLSMGGDGPYRLLYDHAPGFDVLRAVGRIHVLTMLAAAVLAGIAVQRLRVRLPTPGRYAAPAVIVVLIVAEYFSAPVPLFTPEPAPEVDSWMAQQPGDFALVYYPLVMQRDAQRMFRSLRHRKMIVNGLSGFPAPVYAELGRRELTDERTVAELAELGVRYVVVDQTHYHDLAIPIRQKLRRLEPALRGVAELGDDLVYEIAAPWRTRAELHARLAAADAAVLPVERGGWRLMVGDNLEAARLVADGDPRSRWHSTGVQRAGDTFTVRLEVCRVLAGVRLALGRWTGDTPAGLRVDVSRDGRTWTTVWQERDFRLPLTEFLRPTNPRIEARFAAEACQVRVAIDQPRPDAWWSIAELDLLRPSWRSTAGAERAH